MKKYTKMHKKEKAANNHMKKIKERGGTVKKTKTKNGYFLEYSFK